MNEVERATPSVRFPVDDVTSATARLPEIPVQKALVKPMALAVVLAASLALPGCGRPNQDRTAPNLESQTSATQAVEPGVSRSGETTTDPTQAAASRVNDAKAYCLGMVLHAAKNQNRFPTNLDDTLPYLREANQRPSGTNRFDILYLYRGSLGSLPNPMTNGVIVLRSEPWQGSSGKWTRAYGFADGHCEVRSEAGGNFDFWEKQHLAPP